MDFDKDFDKIIFNQFQSDKSTSSKEFFSDNDATNEDEPFTNDLESYFGNF